MKLFRAGVWMRRPCCVAATLGLWLALLPAGAQDFQSWNEVDLVTSWRHVDLLAPLLARTDPAKPNPQLAATGLLVSAKLPWGLSVTPGYLFADLPQGPYVVHLPVAIVTKAVRAGRVSVADGNRFEKLFGYPKAPVRYRNLLLLDCPIGPPLRGHVFLGDEIFFNVSATDYNQNRFQAGVGFAVNRRLLLDLFYLRKDPVGGAAIDAFATRLTVNLKPRARMSPP